jgi:ribosome maturation factor RimP
MELTTTLIEPEIEEQLQAAAERHQCDLIHVDFRGGRLRLVIDRTEGVTIEDCEQVSREASAILDGLDFGRGHYTLEVSSPGLDRELYRPEDYERFEGHRVRVTWREASTESRRTDVGVLTCYMNAGEGGPVISLEVGSTTHNIRLRDVVKARLEPEF